MNEAKAASPPSSAESDRADSRSRSYGFLAWLFLETPDTAFIERMLDADIASYVASLATGGSSHPFITAGLEEMRGWLAAHSHQSPEQLRTLLAVQETWLFKGMAPGYGPPPPYETVYRRPGAGADAETMLNLRRYYREAAAELSPDPRERLDHLGMELDFMRFLCEEESRLWGSGDAGEAARYRRIQRRFLVEHLVAWAPEYCQRILAERCESFFHGVVKVLSGFLAEDTALLEGWAVGDGLDHPDSISIR